MEVVTSDERDIVEKSVNIESGAETEVEYKNSGSALQGVFRDFHQLCQKGWNCLPRIMCCQVSLVLIMMCLSVVRETRD